MSDKAPHKALLFVKINVHEILKTGECAGDCIPSLELEKHGLKDKVILSVDGFDKFECIKKLKQKLDRFNEDSDDSN